MGWRDGRIGNREWERRIVGSAYSEAEDESLKTTQSDIVTKED